MCCNGVEEEEEEEEASLGDFEGGGRGRRTESRGGGKPFWWRRGCEGNGERAVEEKVAGRRALFTMGIQFTRPGPNLAAGSGPCSLFS